jgi:hypothetical protein
MRGSDSLTRLTCVGADRDTLEVRDVIEKRNCTTRRLVGVGGRPLN